MRSNKEQSSVVTVPGNQPTASHCLLQLLSAQPPSRPGLCLVRTGLTWVTEEPDRFV